MYRVGQLTHQAQVELVVNIFSHGVHQSGKQREKTTKDLVCH